MLDTGDILPGGIPGAIRHLGNPRAERVLRHLQRMAARNGACGYAVELSIAGT